MRPATSVTPPSIWLLAAGYFLFYVPYAALTRALADGHLPGASSIGGFELLPVVALANVVGMLVLSSAMGWWRWAGRTTVFGRSVPWPRPMALRSGLCAAVIIGSTTMAYAVAGASIVFMLLLLRGGVLLLAPLLDRCSGRRVAPRSWVALWLSVSAVVIAIVGGGWRELGALAIVDVLCYLAGYLGRLHIISRHTKTRDGHDSLRFFADEHMIASPALVLLLGALAVAGSGEEMLALRRGFTEVLWSSAAVPGAIIGFLYAALFVLGTRIYLDRRENSYCIPINRASSLLAGLAAAVVLHVLFAAPLPGPAHLWGAALVGFALVVLHPPEGWLRRPRARLVLFVCSGNTCRSPVAAALARAEAARRRAMFEVDIDVAGLAFLSAGLTPRLGAPMTPEAVDALRAADVQPGRHRARALTPALVRRAEVIYCLTHGQRDALVQRFPEAAAKVRCLDPDGDVPDPIGQAREAYETLVARARSLVQQRLDELIPA